MLQTEAHVSIQRRSIAVYHIRQRSEGELITEFEQILRDPSRATTFDYRADGDFDARLYIASTEPNSPSWFSFLEEGFGDLGLPMTQRIDALLAVRVSYYRRDHIFAFAFGHGRHLLRPNSYDRSYGLRVALNIIYNAEGKTPAVDRLRSVDSTTITANTIRTRRQVDRRAAFETFGVDIQRDLLKAVTGTPIDSVLWGTRISGSDAFNANPTLEFSDVGKYCLEIARTHRRDAYRRDFDWIDNLTLVSDPALLSTLNDRVLGSIRFGEAYSVTVPELVEWDEIAEFRLSFLSTESFADPEDINLFRALEDAGKSDQLSLANLKSKWRLEAIDSSGDRSHSWPLLACITAEISYDGKAFILSEGEYFQIRQEYLSELDAFIERLTLTEHVLPASVGDLDEGDYNELAADSSNGYLLLDKQTVRVGGITSPIEVCDVLTQDRTFIHIKRKLGSSSLSHLFAQGTVSADLFLMSREYREATLDRVRAQEVARAEATGDHGFVGRFSTFDIDGIKSADYTVAYGIVAKWKNRSLLEALPFFSKVNLRRHAVDLGRMGYRIEMAMIPVA